MNIAIVCPYNIFKPGGVQEHVKAQAAILRSRGHDVTVITPRPRGKKQSDAPDGVFFLGGSARIKAPHATSADISITVDNDTLDEALAANFDVIHVHEPLVPVMPRQILARANCLTVGTFHAALPGNVLGKSLVGSYKAYARGVLPHVKVITAVSPAAVGYIVDSIEDQQVVNYIPNGISFSELPKFKTTRHQNQIVFIGRLEKRKGALYTIRAYALLKQRNPSVSLVICGDGPLRESLELYVERHQIADVSFRGFISDEDKFRILAECGVYTSPALYGESFGIVLAEAMAMGTPIVAHKNDGYAWVLKQTGRLSLVDVHDVESYADRLQLLLEDDTLRGVWQSWASEYVKQFDYERIVDQYEALYNQFMP